MAAAQRFTDFNCLSDLAAAAAIVKMCVVSPRIVDKNVHKICLNSDFVRKYHRDRLDSVSQHRIRVDRLRVEINQSERGSIKRTRN